MHMYLELLYAEMHSDSNGGKSTRNIKKKTAKHTLIYKSGKHKLAVTSSYRQRIINGMAHITARTAKIFILEH